MMIRPVTISDARHISEISSRRFGQEEHEHFSGRHTDAKNLIKTLPSSTTCSLLETGTDPVEIRGVVLPGSIPDAHLRRQATLEIMMGSKWQGQGLGKALMMAALELADKELMLERIEVEIAIDNLNALKLCKSMGFKVEGTAKDWAVSDDGNYIDAYLLARCRPRLK